MTFNGIKVSVNENDVPWLNHIYRCHNSFYNVFLFAPLRYYSFSNKPLPSQCLRKISKTFTDRVQLARSCSAIWLKFNHSDSEIAFEESRIGFWNQRISKINFDLFNEVDENTPIFSRTLLDIVKRCFPNERPKLGWTTLSNYCIWKQQCYKLYTNTFVTCKLLKQGQCALNHKYHQSICISENVRNMICKITGNESNSKEVQSMEPKR